MLCNVVKGRANPAILPVRSLQDSGFKHSKVFKSDRTIVLLIWGVLVEQGVDWLVERTKVNIGSVFERFFVGR